ncbi:MAG: hypothetical protein GON13_03520 [Nanoarchaeota archaeon]|nr:hypothetical protein [Nanoarchaeota archaeon]
MKKLVFLFLGVLFLSGCVSQEEESTGSVPSSELGVGVNTDLPDLSSSAGVNVSSSVPDVSSESLGDAI